MLSAGSFKLCTVLQNQFHSARHKIEQSIKKRTQVHVHLYPLPIMSDMPYMLFPGRYELRHTNPDNPGSIRIESE